MQPIDDEDLCSQDEQEDESSTYDLKMTVQVYSRQRVKGERSIRNSFLREVRESQKTFSALVSAMEKSHKAVVTAIENRQREEEKRVDKLIKELEQEIKELTKDTSETEPTSVNEEPSDELEQMDIYLSAKTAHPALSVSEDRKQVRHTDKLQEVSENPKRFDRVANILAKESFSSGRCYWEVEVGEKIEWNLGIVRQSINRKGKFTVCPANGFWTLGLKASGQYLAYTSPVTHLALDHRTKRVGVFLDYSEGRVSFYCAESGAHIYTFDDKFTDRLHPFFSPGRLHGGKNAAPLILSSSFCSI
ncbi:hypothetical protein NQD34_006337 [Periophthalmus magnuspinnatus]|nr:hypothetical protein NQD34_006337 [Periophthalmus magnuspinnatus]